MAIYSAGAACAMPGDGLDPPDEGSGALIHAADKYSRGLGARTRGASGPRAMRQSVPRAPERPGGRAILPEGYVPLREVKDMSLLGRWPLLDDSMSACMPTRIISAMQHRSALGDHEAAAWLELHARACAGDPEAQRAFALVCENGSHRAAADVQRAFFWYYRAGLQGDLEARRNAERLMHQATRIAPATMAEPVLIHPGQWRITAHLSPQLVSASEFDLLEDGSATGLLLGNSRATVGTPAAAPDASADESEGNSRPHPARYQGGWALDNIGQVLTIVFEASGERRWRAASWQIELIGCKPGSLYGRDRRMVGYTLERLSAVEL